MPYFKTPWKNKQSPPINDNNLNKIEQGLEDALTSITNHLQDGNNPHGVTGTQVNADLASIEATRLSVEQDAAQVSSDRIIVEELGIQVAEDALKTQADAAQTHLDKGLTASAVIQTGEDVAQTGIDRQAVADDRAAVFALKGNVDDVLTQVTEDRVVTLAAKELAEKWASEDEDVVVKDGEYSAKHHALKASGSATSAEQSAIAAAVNKIVWKGEWANQTYQQFEAVEYQGSSWIANKQTDEIPSLSALDWDLLAQKAVIEGGIQWIDVANTPTTIEGYGLVDAAYSGDNQDITSLTGLHGEIRTVSKVGFQTDGSHNVLIGQLTWNQDDGTLDLGMNGGTVVQQIGLETLVHVRADSNIANGQVVMVTGAIGNSGRLTGAPATGLTLDTMKNILGIATEDIATGEWGFVTNFGQVRELNTSAWAEGDSLFYDPTVAGGLTNIMPESPNPKVCLGYVVNSHASVGSIHVDIRIAPSLANLPDVELTNIATEEAITWNGSSNRWENSLAELETGFNTPQTVVETYDPITRTVTLSGTGMLYHRGKKIIDVANGHVSAPHPDTNGVWFYLYRTDGGFQWSSAPWKVSEDAMIGYINYGVADKFAIRECHGLMDWETHREFHEQIGTYRRSGGGVTVLTGSSVPADKQPTIAQTILADEDLPTVLPALGNGSYTHFYLSGSGAPTFSKDNPHIAQIDTVNGRLQYNQNIDGLWQFTTINTQNNYHVVYLVGLPVMADSNSQEYRYVFFQGQQLYTTLAAAQEASFNKLNISNFASLASEWTVLEKFILVSSNLNDGWVIQSNERVVTSRNQALIGSSGITSHTLLEDRDVLDQHPVSSITGAQEALVSGSNIKTINNVSLLGNGNLNTPDTTYTAGNGLELFGSEFLLSTPATIDSSSLNEATENSHTHKLGIIDGGTF